MCIRDRARESHFFHTSALLCNSCFLVFLVSECNQEQDQRFKGSIPTTCLTLQETGNLRGHLFYSKVTKEKVRWKMDCSSKYDARLQARTGDSPSLWQKKKKKKKKIMMIFFCTVLELDTKFDYIILLSVIVLYFLWFKGKTNTVKHNKVSWQVENFCENKQIQSAVALLVSRCCQFVGKILSPYLYRQVSNPCLPKTKSKNCIL